MDKREKLRRICIAMNALCEAAKVLTKLKKKKKKRSCAVRYINRDRYLHGFYHVTFRPMKMHDKEQFFIYTRMNVDLFNALLLLITPEIETVSRMKSSFITAECRLSILLLFLSQGVSMQKIAWSFKMGKETIRCIIYETADILWNTLYPFYVSEPNLSDYQAIEQDFYTMWNLPNCIGAVDGKHIALQCPPNSGSQFFNYKKYHSIVLMATCDAKYRFTMVDVGAYGSQNDSGIFHNSKFGKDIINGTGPIPPPKALPFTNDVIHHFFVGDAAFPLGLHLMRPYAGQNLPPVMENFNKRLSRARRVIENAFGVLVARWRILQTTLHMYPTNAEKIVFACVLLHNYIMLNSDNATSGYCPRNYVDQVDENGTFQEGLWRSDVQNAPARLSPSSSHNAGGQNSRLMREKLANYVSQYY